VGKNWLMRTFLYSDLCPSIWLVGLTEASATSEGYQPSNFDIIPNFVPKTQIHDFTVIDKIENGANSEDLHIIDLDAVAQELLDEILKKSAYLDEVREHQNQVLRRIYFNFALVERTGYYWPQPG
jgi:hypothetical protein